MVADTVTASIIMALFALGLFLLWMEQRTG